MSADNAARIMNKYEKIVKNDYPDYSAEII